MEQFDPPTRARLLQLQQRVQAERPQAPARPRQTPLWQMDLPLPREDMRLLIPRRNVSDREWRRLMQRYTEQLLFHVGMRRDVRAQLVARNGMYEGLSSLVTWRVPMPIRRSFAMPTATAALLEIVADLLGIPEVAQEEVISDCTTREYLADGGVTVSINIIRPYDDWNEVAA